MPQSKVDNDGRSKRNVLDSFTSFYLNSKAHPNAEARNKREAESDLEKRNGLDSFTSFYLPKIGNADRGKRDVLEPFTSFYMAKSAAKDSGRNKRESQAEENEG